MVARRQLGSMSTFTPLLLWAAILVLCSHCTEALTLQFFGLAI